jgi:hypothetical protein
LKARRSWNAGLFLLDGGEEARDSNCDLEGEATTAQVAGCGALTVGEVLLKHGGNLARERWIGEEQGKFKV